MEQMLMLMLSTTIIENYGALDAPSSAPAIVYDMRTIPAIFQYLILTYLPMNGLQQPNLFLKE